MRKTSLFIAISLDGYIADSSGGVDWLQGHGNPQETVDSYGEFIADIDTVLMGWNTYYQIATELSPGQWVYDGLTTYVITHRQQSSTEKICFTDRNPVDLLEALKQKTGKGIWICGGASLVQQLVRADAIDRYYITVIPILLGSGIRLFDVLEKPIKLKLIFSRSYNGMTDLLYEKRSE